VLRRQGLSVVGPCRLISGLLVIRLESGPDLAPEAASTIVR
jgi:hypothetical protein